MKFNLVIAAYNSENSIAIVVKTAHDALKKLYDDTQFRIIVVDDYSQDNTWTILRDLKRKIKNVSILRLSRNFGQQQAMMAGFSLCDADFVGYSDDDGESPVSDLPLLIKKLYAENVDMVWAKYAERELNILKSLGKYVHDLMLRLAFGKPKSLEFGNMWVARRFLIDELVKIKTPKVYIGGALLSITKNMMNFPLTKCKRIAGSSNYNLFSLARVFYIGFIYSSTAPLKIASFLGLGLAVFGFLSLSLIIFMKLNGFLFPMGYASLVSLIILIGGIQLAIIGLLGEYLSTIFQYVSRRPQFVISERLV